MGHDILYKMVLLLLLLIIIIIIIILLLLLIIIILTIIDSHSNPNAPSKFRTRRASSSLEAKGGSEKGDRKQKGHF